MGMMQRSAIDRTKSGVPNFRVSMAVSLRRIDIKEFSMRKFAENYFNLYAMTPPKSKQRLQTPVRELLMFSKHPLQEPLLNYDYNHQEAQAAVDCFLSIMKFMEDYPLSKKETVIQVMQRVIQYGID